MLGGGLTFLELEIDKLSNQENLVASCFPCIEIVKLLPKRTCSCLIQYMVEYGVMHPLPNDVDDPAIEFLPIPSRHGL